MNSLRKPLVALLLVALAVGRLAAYTPTHPPLATGKQKFLGCAYSADSIPNFANYFNQVTPGNGGKWGSVEATRDVMNWTDFDNAYRLAKSNGFKFRYHVLVWGSQQPSWIDSLPPAEQLDEIKEWFAAVAAHTVDGETINPDWIEVVNEPLHAPPNGELIAFSTTVHAANYIAALGGTGSTGWDWILNAFRLARQYFPGKKLAINEYGVTNDATAMARYVGIINLLKAENLVDVVSFQAHSFETKDYPTATLSANLDTLAATGLPIIVSEMDVDDTAAAPQLPDFQRIFSLFWEHPSVIGVTLWGYRPGMWRPDATLVLADGTEKPAMLWLKSYVGNNLPVVTAGQTLTVPSSATNGTLVGIVQATDADAGTTLQDWSIVGGTAAGAFTINASSGALSLGNVSLLNFATTPTYTLLVKVGDGIGHSVPATVTLSAAPAPVFGTDLEPSYTAFAGIPFMLNVYASGSPYYEWLYSADGVNFISLSGGDHLSRKAFYSFDNATVANSGYYRVLALNEAGGATYGRISRINFVPLAVAAVRPDGYAASTTGGGTAESADITVATAAELRAAATAAEPRVITFNGTLDIGTLDVASNKTIQGASADAALLGTLRIGAGVTNVVVRSLTLSSPAGDALVVAGGSRVFVTRCTFLDVAGHQLAITDGADQVTVSWCEFTFASNAAANRRSVLLGRAGAETKTLHVTMHHNFWHGPVASDMPLATYAYLHLYNNFLSSEGNVGGAVADNQTQLLNERNVYSYMKDPLVKLQGGLVRTVATDYTNCTGVAPDAGADSVFVPTYGYTLLSAADAYRAVGGRAGNPGGAMYPESIAPTVAITGASAAVTPGTSLGLNATVSGGIANKYQWRRGGAELAGATSATYTATMSSAEAGIYTVEAALSTGELVVSAPATVTLGSAPPPAGGTTGGTTGGGSTGGSSSGGGGGGSLGLGLCGALAALGALRRLRR